MPLNPNIIHDHVFEPSVAFGDKNDDTARTPPTTKNDATPERTPGPSRIITDENTPVLLTKSCRTPQKSPKRSFRSVLPIP